MKLMDIETEHLGIPSEEYKCTVSMPSGEFQRIVRDLAVIGETCESLVEFEAMRLLTVRPSTSRLRQWFRHWSMGYREMSLVLTILTPHCSVCSGTIACTKEGVKFSVAGDLGKGNVTVRHNTSVEKEEDQVRTSPCFQSLSRLVRVRGSTESAVRRLGACCISFVVKIYISGVLADSPWLTTHITCARLLCHGLVQCR